MDTIDKLKAVQNSPEVLAAVKLLIAAFNECELKSHIRFGYTFHENDYEITFLPINTKVTYIAERPDEDGK